MERPPILSDIRPATVGVDAGASLCKVVHQGRTFEVARYSSAELPSVRSLIREWGPRRVGATGGGASLLRNALDAVEGLEVTEVPEFEAWARGARMLAEKSGVELPRRFMLVSLGTGTSMLAIEGDTGERVGGSALGGGTLCGLGSQLLGTADFDEITALARAGDRRNVDLLVRDIYQEGGIALHPDLNAASFGKLSAKQPSPPSREDLAHALVGMIGENLGIIASVIARAAGLEQILFCGSTLHANPPLEKTLSLVALGLERRALFLPDGAYCGAVGAAALAA